MGSRKCPGKIQPIIDFIRGDACIKPDSNFSGTKLIPKGNLEVFIGNLVKL